VTVCIVGLCGEAELVEAAVPVKFGACEDIFDVDSNPGTTCVDTGVGH
jgi:hypothetical protein